MWFLQNTVSQGSSGAHARDLRAEVNRPLQTHLPMAWDGAASPSHTTDTRAGGVVIWRDMQRVASWDSSTGLRWWGEDQHFSSGRTRGGSHPRAMGTPWLTPHLQHRAPTARTQCCLCLCGQMHYMVHPDLWTDSPTIQSVPEQHLRKAKSAGNTQTDPSIVPRMPADFKNCQVTSVSIKIKLKKYWWCFTQ